MRLKRPNVTARYAIIYSSTSHSLAKVILPDVDEQRRAAAGRAALREAPVDCKAGAREGPEKAIALPSQALVRAPKNIVHYPLILLRIVAFLPASWPATP